MKLSKLLVLSALFAFTANSAKAGAPEGVWTMPEPQGLEFTTFTDDGTHYYLYNPGAKMFFASGNSWNTQASVRVYGYAFWLQEATEEGAPEGSYELWNYVQNPQRTDVTGEHNVFWDGGSAWVDHGSQAGYTWNFTLNGEFVRFQVVTALDKYIGWDGTYINSTDASAKASSVLKMLDPNAEGVCVDWKAVTEESYNAFVESDAYQAYVNGAETYIASLDLKRAINDAEDLYIDLTAALAVYNNTESTVEELNKAASDLSPIITAKRNLKNAIEEYESKGFTDTAAAKAVFTNTQATVAEVEQAHKDLDAAFVEWGTTQASVEKPIDMTAKITNPNFDNASNAGWLGTAPNMVGSGSHGPANVAEHWNKTFDTYQDIDELPAGVYKLFAETSWRGTWENLQEGVTGSKVYATVGDVEYTVPFNNTWAPKNTTPLAGPTSFGTNAAESSGEYENEEGELVTYYIPNDPSCFRVYADKGWYDTEMMFTVEAGDKVRVGVALPSGVSSDNWSCFDTFKLTFYGNGTDAWLKYASDAWTFQELELDEDEVLYTESYLEAYNAAATIDRSGLTTADEIKAALANVKNAYAALQKNISLWKEWKTTCDRAQDHVTDLGWTDPWKDVAAYLYDAEDIELDRELTNEELEAEIAKIQAMIEACEKFAKENLKPGTDVTFYLKNPDFESGVHRGVANPSGLSGDYGTADGWNADKTASGNFTPGPDGKDNDPTVNHSFEAWHCWGFDLWQEVEDLPAGVYQIDVQGYVRCEKDGYNRGDEIEGSIPVKLYLNNSLTDFPNVYSEHISDEYRDEEGNLPVIESWTWETVNDEQFPNSMGGAGLCFGWGMYKKSAFGLVKEGQPMRIGVKSMNMNEHWWVIWDNFKLTYQGFLPEYVKPALQEALASINIEGLLIGKDVRENVAKLIADAEALLNEEHDNGDTEWGKAMYNLLDKIYDVKPAVDASVALFEKLNAALTDLENALYDAQASTAVQNEAAALQKEVEDGIFNESFTDAEAQEYIDKINAMITKLALPDYSNASDENPIDVTAAIKSASFEAVDEYDEKTNSSAGWTNPCNLGNDDTQKLAFAMEQWHADVDMYQDIIGLPEGTYLLQVDALCEVSGSSDTNDRANDSYKAWLETPNYTPLFLYGVDGEGVTYSTAVANVAKAAPKERPEFYSDNEDAQNALDAEVKEVTIGEEIYYWPTSLISARYFLDLGKDGGIDGAYTNKVILKVKADGKLRVGLKATFGTANWGVWDDFRLFYYGPNSTKDVSGNQLTVESVTMGQPVKVEFFTLDGRKVNGVQKGIVIQKITLENGTVVVRKVRK